MDITCISDLHGHYPNLEGGDLLIVAGDLTARDTHLEHSKFLNWIRNQDYKKKIYISGNHDGFLFERYGHESFYKIESHEIIYLQDSGTEFEYYDPKFPEEDEAFLASGKRTLKIWGSPWTKTFEGMNPCCKAFTVDTEEELAEKWKLIPDDIDILITHCPPYGIMDEVESSGFWERTGSKSLLTKARTLNNLKLFVFGHIHENYGIIRPIDLEQAVKAHAKRIPTCKSLPNIVNASHVNERYEPVNKPIRVIL